MKRALIGRSATWQAERGSGMVAEQRLQNAEAGAAIALPGATGANTSLALSVACGYAGALYSALHQTHRRAVAMRVDSRLARRRFPVPFPGESIPRAA
ncbi:MAG: hypothetical protein QHJ73_09920 [Armatimonadota bacterium]|nr:hypothetical protein [Armatimonadota bacterium]